jgi:NADH-quinone oxidoreductase subunit G
VDLSARVSDIDHADVILVLDTELVDEAPILDLRVRKAVRRNGARLVVASARPSTLDAAASTALRFAPGAAEGALGALAAALDRRAPAGRSTSSPAVLASRAGSSPGGRTATGRLVRNRCGPLRKPCATQAMS